MIILQTRTIHFARNIIFIAIITITLTTPHRITLLKFRPVAPSLFQRFTLLSRSQYHAIGCIPALRFLTHT